MEALALLRRLAEQHDYRALRQTCLELASDAPALQVLLALADIQLGDASAARRALAALNIDTLTIDARVDLAAVNIALGEIDQAVAILDAARDEPAPRTIATEALLLARLAWCRLQEGEPADALSLYEYSAKLQPMIAVYQQLLHLYYNDGRLEQMAACLAAAQRFWQEERAGWPDEQRLQHSQQLRNMRLDLWLAREQDEAADAWIEDQRHVLGEDEWCALLCAWAARLAARDRHADAEEALRRGLNHHPKHLPLYVQLAELAQAQGRALQAGAILRQAIRVAKAQKQPTELLWIRLSTAIAQSNPTLARKAAEQAQAELTARTAQTANDTDTTGAQTQTLADPHPQIELALAGVETQEQDFGLAEERYRRLLEQQPHMIPALQGLGQLLMQLGRINEAAALFEQVSAMDPARGYSALINARRFPQDDATLERLEQLARTPGMHGSVRTGLLLQLAAAWEQREDYDRAFALAEQANAATRRSLRYDKQAHRQRCARIRHAFPKALYEHRPDTGYDSTLPVFVVGMPRSGTTLVEQIIAGHSRIHGAGELGTIPRVIAGLERWERYTGSGRRYPDCVDDLNPTVSRGIAANVLRELREYAPEADYVVDKLPHNFENIGLIRLLFPQAKIISVRRDPRDIAISNFFTDYAAKHGGMGFAYDLDWIGEQLADHNLLMHHWQKVFGEDIFEIQYEAVVDDPGASAARLLDYIGVDWEPQVLEFDALQRPVKTASVWQVRQPLYASSKGRWQRYATHLQPLITATNRKITWEPIEMVTLPEPGWLNTAVHDYRQGDLDAAECRLKQLLQHLPEHAAACFMLGLIYVRKGHLDEGIPLMAQALERCPWNRNWRNDLAQAYRLAGRHQEAAAALDARNDSVAPDAEAYTEHAAESALDYLYLSGESTC